MSARRQAKPRRKASRAARRARQWRFWPSARWRKRCWRAFTCASGFSQLLIVTGVALVGWFVLNLGYQVLRKPSELFFPVSGALYKTPAETWRDYAPLFRADSTSVMTPEFLAAMAQVEASGNPVARTYWRWSWSSQPFEVFRPASSAVGMYQITDGNFAEARRYCIHHHRVAEQGPWNTLHSCWFNALYARVLPGDAVELTSAYLDHTVTQILQRYRVGYASLARRQQLASVIHLCGAGSGEEFVRRGFRLLGNQRCGDHEVRDYLARIEAFRNQFERLARSDS